LIPKPLSIAYSFSSFAGSGILTFNPTSITIEKEFYPLLANAIRVQKYSCRISKSLYLIDIPASSRRSMNKAVKYVYGNI